MDNRVDVSFHQSNDNVRRMYDQLVKTRNAQLKYMASRRTKGFGDIVTPDLIVQYNYLHQLMRSLRTGMPPDMCIVDGGITCSKLSVLKSSQITGSQLEAFPAALPVAEDADYLASRIIDLLERPVAARSDRELAVNVRDEFAANMKALSQLFEERYRLCQERSERTRNQLVASKQRLEASRAAVYETTGNGVHDQTILRMRQQITRYKTQLRAIREQIESLREMYENSIRSNQNEVETLKRRIGQPAQEGNNGVFLSLLKSMVGSVEAEREHLTAVLEQLKSVNERYSHELLTPPIRIDNDRQTTGNGEAEESRLRARLRELDENGVEQEIVSRTKVIEDELRAAIKQELDSRVQQIRHDFDVRLSQANVQYMTVDPSTGVVQQATSPTENLDLLKRFKSTLDSHFALDPSVTEVVPLLPRYEFPERERTDRRIIIGLYNHCSLLLGEMNEIYKSIPKQTGTLNSILEFSRKEFVPIEFMMTQRTMAFVDHIENTINPHGDRLGAQRNPVLTVIGRVREELTAFKTGCDELYQSGNLYRNNKEAWKKKRDEVAKLTRRRDRLLQELPTKCVREELQRLREENCNNRATIRRLQTSLDEAIGRRQTNQDTYIDDSDVTLSPNSKGNFEQSIGKNLVTEFSLVYNQLVTRTIEIVTEYVEFFQHMVVLEPKPPVLVVPDWQRGPSRTSFGRTNAFAKSPPVYVTLPVLRDFAGRFNRLLDKADKAIKNGNLRRLDRKLERTLESEIARHGSGSSPTYFPPPDEPKSAEQYGRRWNSEI